MDAAIFGLAAIADGDVDNNPYFLSFQSKLSSIAGLTSIERQNLLDSARSAITSSVIPAYQELRQALQGLSANAPPSIGVAQYSLGAEYYNYQLRHHTTTNMTTAEIHLREFHRVVFSSGGIPLALLDSAVDRHITEKLAAL